MEIFLLATSSFAVGLSGAMVPGPMLTVTISDSMKKGFIAGPMVVLGHFIAESALIILLFTGIGWLVSSNSATFVIGTLGGFIMVFMGYRIIRSSHLLTDIQKEDVSRGYGSILSGVITTFSNPFFFLWWVTVGWAFMFKGLELAGIVGILGFLLGHWASDLGWFSTVSFFTSQGSRVITEKHYKIIMRASGIFLMMLGIYFFLNAQKIF